MCMTAIQHKTGAVAAAYMDESGRGAHIEVFLYTGYLVVDGDATAAVIGRVDRVAASDWP